MQGLPTIVKIKLRENIYIYGISGLGNGPSIHVIILTSEKKVKEKVVNHYNDRPLLVRPEFCTGHLTDQVLFGSLEVIHAQRPSKERARTLKLAASCLFTSYRCVWVRGPKHLPPQL